MRINDPWDRNPGTPGAPGAYLNTHDHGSQYVLSLQQFANARIAHRDGAREAVRVLNSIQLLFDRLPQRRIVDQAENK